MDKEMLMAKIAECERQKEQIKVLQASEKVLRLEILKELFGENCVGSMKCIVGKVMVKGTYTLEHNVDSKGFAAALAADNIPDECMDGIRTKYELDKKGYDNLDEEFQLILDDFITTKPALPSIEFSAVVEDDE